MQGLGKWKVMFFRGTRPFLACKEASATECRLVAYVLCCILLPICSAVFKSFTFWSCLLRLSNGGEEVTYRGSTCSAFSSFLCILRSVR